MTLTQSITRVALATALLLLIPLTAKLFLPEMAWSLGDFVAAGVLLFGAGLTFVLIARMGDNTAYRLAAGVAVAAGLLLVWGNLAVGFIGNEDNPANLLYGGVLAVGLIGAIAARFQPLGMARAMFAASLAQFLVPFIAAIIWRPEVNLGMIQVIMLNTVFATLWIGSALLFRRASAIGSNSGRQLA
ncbi:hypothetical protein [Hymenobacter terrenus]|uniref:hypothetical protein n=1 Tax=Hymenobacter terrenus TaxID=1629124 RepID=UPI000619E1C9|nr:hypothetical protein [Hymenobacter terrenus]